jgi:hypothetical protein
VFVWVTRGDSRNAPVFRLKELDSEVINVWRLRGDPDTRLVCRVLIVTSHTSIKVVQKKSVDFLSTSKL